MRTNPEAEMGSCQHSQHQSCLGLGFLTVPEIHTQLLSALGLNLGNNPKTA